MIAFNGVVILIFALAVAGTGVAYDKEVKAAPAAAGRPSPVKAQPPSASPSPSYVSDLVLQARKLLAQNDSGDRDRPVRMLNQAVQIGDGDAMLLLGGMYRRGDTVQRDPARAERLLRAALIAGKVQEASFELGNLYSDPGPSQNLPQARLSYEAAIALNHVEAKVRMARLMISGAGSSFALGEARRLLEAAIAAGATGSGEEALGDFYLLPGGTRSPREAAAAYSRAADAGNGHAMVKLAAMLTTGNGVPIDVNRAQQLLKQAIRAGSAAAAWVGLGDLYRADSELRSDAKALAAYRAAVTLGDASAMVKLADLFTGGKPQSSDLPQARKLLEAAVAAGSAGTAGLALGDLLRADSPVRDLPAAARAYAAAATAGNTGAMVRLAEMYVAGEGVEVDRAKAVSLLRHAIDGGEGSRVYEMLGDIYLQGSAPEDGAKAVAAYQSAVDAGSPSATAKLARLIASGKGVRADPAWARKMLEDAVAVAGTGETWRGLGDIYRIPGTGFTDTGRALAAYGQAAELGDTRAMVEMGAMLSDGKSVPPDYGRAVGMYEQAIAGGDVAGAAEALGRLYLRYPQAKPDLAQARKYLEMAAAAGSGPAHLEVATLAQDAYRNALERRAIVDHLRAAARLVSPQSVSVAMMRLPAPALLATTQQLLADSGQRIAVDGKFGQPTSAAIGAFCAAKGIKTCEKTFVTVQLLEALVSNQ